MVIIRVTLNLTELCGSDQLSSVIWFIQSSFGSSLVRGMRYGVEALNVYRQTFVDSFSTIFGSSMTILSPTL